MYKDILFADECRQKLANGVNILFEAVKSTMGPKGRNAMIERGFGIPHITKDGATVAESIFISEKLANMGAQLVKSVASDTAKEAGDGTTTATVLTATMFNAGVEFLATGSNPIYLKRGMELGCERVIKTLEANSKQVTTDEEIRNVATISANSDGAIAELVVQSIDAVGMDGTITVEMSMSEKDSLETVVGMEFPKGYTNAFFNTDGKPFIEMENALILVTDIFIDSIDPLIPLLSAINKPGQQILIIGNGFSDSATNMLVLNKVKKIINVVAVDAPGFGNGKVEILSDIAVTIGAQLISKHSGHELSTIQPEDLGFAEKVIVKRDSTLITSNAGVESEIAKKIDSIKIAMELSTDKAEINKLQYRLSKLSGGVASLKVGGGSEIEAKERKDRVEDSLAATKAAIAEGIVVGGGYALLQASFDLKAELLLTPDNQNTEIYCGQQIICDAIQRPFYEILKNAGLSDSDCELIKERLMDSDINSKHLGFDASLDFDAENCLENFFDIGIIDPLKVTKIALKNAVSVASMLLTTETAIINEKVDK